jgi:hypothetical protein
MYKSYVYIYFFNTQTTDISLKTLLFIGRRRNVSYLSLKTLLFIGGRRNVSYLSLKTLMFIEGRSNVSYISLKTLLFIEGRSNVSCLFLYLLSAILHTSQIHTFICIWNVNIFFIFKNIFILILFHIFYIKNFSSLLETL